MIIVVIIIIITIIIFASENMVSCDANRLQLAQTNDERAGRENCLSKWRQTAVMVSGEDVGLNPGTPSWTAATSQSVSQGRSCVEFQEVREFHPLMFTIDDQLLQPADQVPRQDRGPSFTLCAICDVTKGKDTSP